MVCVWAAPPTCMSRGLRAYQGVYAHTQRLTCECTMWLAGRYHPVQAPDNVREQPIPPGTAQNADPFSHNRRYLTVFTQWVCTLATAPPRTAAAPPPIGGNCTTRGSDTPATRRQKASCSAKPPPPPVWSALQGREGQDGAPVGGGNPATAHTEGATTKQISPNKNHAAPLRYKTLPAHPLAPHVRDKTLPARPFSPHFRYKTLPAHPKWLDLALFRHAGRVLYRMRGRDGARQHNRTPGPQAWRAPKGLAAAPVGGGGPGRSIHKQQQHPAQANFACNSPTTRIDARSKTAEYQRLDFNT